MVEDLAADVVEEDVDVVGRVLAQVGEDVVLLVVDRGVEPELLQQRDLLRAAGDPDGARALDLRDLPNDGADGPGRAGDQHGVAFLQAPDLEQPEVRGQAGHPERAEVGGE